MSVDRTGPDPLELHIEVEEDQTNAVDLLHVASGLSKQAVKSAMLNGSVWITRGNTNQRLRRAKRVLQTGDEVHLYYDARIQAERPPTPTLIQDVGAYSVWHKPSGMRSQGSKWGDHCTIMRWAEQNLEPERTAFTVHRLDLAASGLILVAHSKTTAASLATLFRERRIEKQYHAVVEGDFSHHTTPLVVETPVDGKTAYSEVRFLEHNPKQHQSLVEVTIETGRKHQIRRHLADSGFPIVGDRLHGHAGPNDPDLQLTASRVAFHCPVNNAQVAYVLPGQWLPTLAKSGYVKPG